MGDGWDPDNPPIAMDEGGEAWVWLPAAPPGQRWIPLLHFAAVRRVSEKNTNRYLKEQAEAWAAVPEVEKQRIRNDMLPEGQTFEKFKPFENTDPFTDALDRIQIPTGNVEDRRQEFTWRDSSYGGNFSQYLPVRPHHEDPSRRDPWDQARSAMVEGYKTGRIPLPVPPPKSAPAMTKPAPVVTPARPAITPDTNWQAETYQRWRDLERNEAVATNPRVEAAKALVRTAATMAPGLSPEMKKLVNRVTRPSKNQPLIDGTYNRPRRDITAPAYTPNPAGYQGNQSPGGDMGGSGYSGQDVPTAGQDISGMGAMQPGTSIRDSLLNILDRFSNAVAGGARDPSGLASPFTVFGSALEDGQPFYFPSELYDTQTIASMTQAPAQTTGVDGVPVMGAPPMGASLSMFPVPGYEGALQNDWMEPREYRGGYHEGTDIVAPQGTPIVAPASGTIVSIHTSENGGNVVWLVDSEGRTHKFMHLLATSSGIGTGTAVEAGQVIAFVGDTGASSTPHLHYELHVGGAAVDPHEYLLGVSSGSAVGGSATPAASAGEGAAPIPPSSPSLEGSLEDLENKVRSTGPVIE